ncbi:MAG: 50S ribosomal protein L10, partial [Candidatus Omnitrophica bacterium]|nr:50S ribosomal protein L10 [Candidatus Omnitrophota bacterium]
MKKISLIAKEKIIDEIVSRQKNFELCVFVQLDRIKAFSLNIFRNNLSKIDAVLLVAKNSLIERAFSFFN